MYTHSGVQVDETEGAPTTQDVAVALGRIPRLCGSSRVWWSYLHYSYALMEMALLENRYYDYDPDEVAIQALIREAHSAITVLWPPANSIKDEIQERIHVEWDVPYPASDSSMRELIDRAATRTFLAEVDNFAPATMKELPIFGDSSPDDCRVIHGIWERQHSPESTAGNFPESVLAYSEFFSTKDIQRLRHRIGYDRKKWFADVCQRHLI